VLTAGDSPPIAGAYDVIVVVADGVGIAPGEQDQGVDIGTNCRGVSVDVDGLIRHPVHGVCRSRVGRRHERRHFCASGPLPDFAVIHLGVVGKYRCQQGVLGGIDGGRIAHREFDDLVTVGHATSPFGCTTTRGGPSVRRACSIAPGTSSRPMTRPTLGIGSSRPSTTASSTPYQSCGIGPPPNWTVNPLRVASVMLRVSPVYQPPA